MRTFRAACTAALVVLLAVPAGAGVSFELSYAVGEHGIGRQAFDRPVDVVEDRQENIYDVDQGNTRIEGLDRRGNFVREWGGRGFAPGPFDVPTAINVDGTSGNLFVVDKLNHRIQKFDTTGKLLMTLGRLGSGQGNFNNPLDVAIDRRGFIYVADTGNNRIQKFDASGAFLAEWGRFSRRRGTEVSNPVSIAFSEEGFGYIYVLNTPECRVQKYDTDGNLVLTWLMHRKGEGAVCGPSRIRIDQRRYTVYIADTENNRVILFDKEGEPLGDLRGGDVPFKRPGGLFVNDVFGEYVIVADTGNNLIQKFRRTR